MEEEGACCRGSQSSILNPQSSILVTKPFRFIAGQGRFNGVQARLYTGPKRAEPSNMKRFAVVSMLLALIWVASSPSAASAATLAESHGADAPVPGSELARELSEITGVAISPLLGVSAVGVWKYFHAGTAQERARLPWFAQPWFWIPGLLLVTAWFLKDVLGVAAPPLLKKPLDVADALSHKVSGLIATGAFVPLIISVFPSARPEAALPHASGFLAMVDLSWLGNAMLVPFAMVIFFVVFLASNALNILILLSPFGPVDAILKAFRGLLLLTVTATAFVNPWLGAAWALVIITVAYFISGWSSRLSWLGLEASFGTSSRCGASASLLTRPPTACSWRARSTGSRPAPMAR